MTTKIATPTSQTLFFNNKALLVTKYKVEVIGEFQNNRKYCIPHNIEYSKTIQFKVWKFGSTYDVEIFDKDNPFLKVLENTSRFSQDDFIVNKKQLINKLYTIGYLLHSYKDAERPWTVFAANHLHPIAATGKSFVFSTLLKAFKNVVYLNGRDKKIFENPFVFSHVTKNTDVIMVDDFAGFKYLDGIICNLSNTLIINALHKKTIELAYKTSPKAVFTADNFPPKLEFTPTVEHRTLTVLFGDYYADNKGIKEDFGRILYDTNTTQEEWNQFYNFGIQCLQFYLACPDKISSF